MDEILTRWASDLSKYQKEFQAQASQIAEWDRLLVTNTDRISALYKKTFDAERDTAEVERQLTSVEAQQEELEAMLDRFEGVVGELMGRVGVGAAELGRGFGGQGGADAERERTYGIAEKAAERLAGLNRDLADMIGEVNGVGAELSRAGKSDDPVSCWFFGHDFFFLKTVGGLLTSSVSALTGRSGAQWPSRAAAGDRLGRCGAAGQGRGRAEGGTALGRCEWLPWLGQ